MEAKKTMMIRIRIAAYWIATVLVAQELVAGSIWALYRLDYVNVNLAHLGYPRYLQSILGAWAFPCAVTLLVPRFGGLKEWAYAGAVFDYSGAVASHAIVGDGPDRWAAPFVFAVLVLASWALRPPERRLAATTHATEARTLAWVVPVLVIAVMLIVALVTVPKGLRP